MLFRHRNTYRALAAFGGPLILGAVIGLPFGIRKVLAESLLLPAIVIGVAILTAPALYIGTTLVGVAPPASRMAETLARGLSVAGTVMAGLAPAAAFLLATSRASPFVHMCATLSLGGAALAGLRAVRRDLAEYSAEHARATSVFAIWAGVTLALGAHLFFDTLRA